MGWLTFSILSLLLWGLWGFFLKMSGRHINAISVTIYGTLAAVATEIIMLFLLKLKLDMSSKGGFLFALVGGVAATLASICFILALARGKLAITVFLTALYPVITVLLALVFLRESLSVKQVIGMIFACIALILLAG